MSADQINSSSAETSESHLKRLRIEEIKERRRRFHKETAERWILQQQFGGDSSSSTTSSSSIVHRINKSFVPHLADSSCPSIDSETSHRTLQSGGEDDDDIDISSGDCLDSFSAVAGESTQIVAMSSNTNSHQNNSSSGSSSKPLSDRNSFLNAFEFFSKGNTEPNGETNVPIPKPRSFRSSSLTSPTSEPSLNQFNIGGLGSPERNGSDNVHSSVLKFQENVQPRLASSPESDSFTVSNRKGSDGANKCVKLKKSSLKLELDGGGSGDRDSSSSNSGLDDPRKSSPPPFLEGNVSRRIGMFAKRQGQGDEEHGTAEDEGLFGRRKRSLRSNEVTSCSSAAAPYVTAHSPPARHKFSPEDSSLDYNRSNRCSSPRTIDEVETPSTSSASTAQHTPADTLPPPPPLSDPPIYDHIRKRPSIPDILVLDPIVIITDEESCPTPPQPVSRRRPSSILKKRDSTTDDNSAPNSTTVSFACVDPKYDDDDDECCDRGVYKSGDGYLFSTGGAGASSSEPYRRRSRSYSGSSSASASAASGANNSRRRNSAEAPYYNYSSTEDFNNVSSSPGSKGILKHSCSSLSVDGGTSSSCGAHSDSEFKSILKQPALRRSSLGSNIHTVHQTRFSDDYDFDDHSPSSSPHNNHSGGGHRSILKRKSSTSSSQPDVSTASSLRSTASSYCSSRESLHEPSSEPKPILKKKSSSEEISDSDYNSTSITPPPPRPILKNKRNSTASGSLEIDSNYSSESIPILVRSSDPTHPIKPCLKKPCKSFDESALWSSSSSHSNNGNLLESTSSIMRKSSPHICSVKRCEEDSANKSEEEEEESEPDFGKLLPKNSVLFARRDSDPITPPPTEMEDSVLATRRGSGETFSFKRKIELGKIDFSGVYESGGSKLSPPPTTSTSPSSTDTSPSSGISSPTSTPTTSSTSPKKLSGHGNVITQKIAALQNSGESSWKRRVSKLNPEVEITDGLNGENETTKIQEKRTTQNGILANRLSMLESSQESWRKRVGEKDAKEFTVQGKLERAGKKVMESVGGSDEKESSPVTTPTKKKSTSSSFKNVFRGMRGSKTDESIGSRISSSGTSGGQCVMIAVKADDGGSTSKSSIFQRSKSMRYGKVSAQSSPPSQNGGAVSPTSEPPSTQHVVIPVMRNDNETFQRFFNSSESDNLKPVDHGVFSVVVEDDSFNSIIKTEDSRQLLGNKRQVKVARKKERGVKNPIKALAGRLGSQEQSYIDLNPEIRETENIRRRIRMENSKSAAHAHLSIEALAGLASKEDFTSVKLRRAQQEISAQYPYPLLIRIKGKRFVQTRLAAPEVGSLNSGDNYILITQTKLFHFIGEYSNRMERSKSLDIVAHVLQKKEFGCNLHTKVITLQEESGCGSGWDSFFEVLGCQGKDSRKIMDDPELLGDEADEAYEGRVISRNKVWRVITGDELDEKLVPLREYWGTVPKHSLLESTEVLIFDFGGEMYVWSGSKAAFDKKRLGYRLAQEIFEMEGLGKEFDDVKGTTAGGKGGKKEELRRPSWCWLRKVNQHMESILFIEKFFDWPEEVGRIRVGKNTPRKSESENGGAINNIFIPCDAAALSKSYYDEVPDVSLILEGFDVRRGRSSSDNEEKRNYSISTTKLQTWAISEFSKTELGESQLGYFNSGGTYVIRWQYTISFVGKDLRGNQSRHNASTLGGRDRCAYFFWHGKRSKITEQGASALMTVELDDLEEKNGLGSASSRGPQIRVEQNYEPPAFLSLFNGRMFIHDNHVNMEGEPGLRSKATGRLYVTLGNEEEEAHFLEVACSLNSLRGNGTFLLFDLDHRVVFVWVGKGSSAEMKKFAIVGANQTLKNPNWSPSPTKVVTVKQSHETDAFWSCLLGSNGSKKDVSRRVWLRSVQIPVEMFRFTSLNGKFEAIPVISPRRTANVVEVFPVIQEDLYGANVSQPSMFLFISPDNTLYLWQGWRRIIKREFIPEEEANDISQQAVDSIPLTTIWPKYRRCSVETSLNYAQLRKIRNCYLIFAGIEPVEFTQLFPYWDPNSPSVKEAHEYHIAEGKRNGEQIELSKVLVELTSKKTFTVEELMEKPEGVDLSRLEDYVSDVDFQRLFSMSRTQFGALQAWRKAELKKQVGLF